QTTGHHDNQSLRELFGKKPIKEFFEWLQKHGIMTEDGKLTDRAGDPSIFLK
ncbi:MAG: ethanolamine ammonia-lyase subunit EutB, partial [Fusobacterium gastrosuis]|nr:ethanolamine ammonia-lyase subunit EutB [Fusobacterium gastrosuis]